MKAASVKSGIEAETIRRSYEAILSVLLEDLSDGKDISLPNFARFKVVDVPARKERMAKNPKTGVEFPVPARPETKRIRVFVADAVEGLVLGENDGR